MENRCYRAPVGLVLRYQGAPPRPPVVKGTSQGAVTRTPVQGTGTGGGGALAPRDRALPEPWAWCLLSPTGCSIPAASGAGPLPELSFLHSHVKIPFFFHSLSFSFFKLILNFINFSCNRTTCQWCSASPGLCPVPCCCYFITDKLVSELFPFLVKVVVKAAHS